MINPFSISRLGVGLGPSYLSAVGFKETTAGQNGKSGYWRLFYYQLQEAELEKEKLKREQEQGQKASEGKSEVPQAKPVAAAKPERAPPERRAAPVVELPKVHPRPIYREPPKQVSIEPWLHVLSSEFRAWSVSTKQAELFMREQKAANDEEEEVLTLLLLAA